MHDLISEVTDVGLNTVETGNNIVWTVGFCVVVYSAH